MELVKCITYKEFLLNVAQEEPQGLLSVSQLRTQVAELKIQKDEAIKKEDFKSAQKYKLDIDRNEDSIRKLTEKNEQIEKEIKTLTGDMNGITSAQEKVC